VVRNGGLQPGGLDRAHGRHPLLSWGRFIQEAAMAHKFEIYKDKSGEFRVRFKYNSEVMFSTEGYASKSGAKAAIESIKKNAPGADIDDTTD
jgi:uncharacterized protein